MDKQYTDSNGKIYYTYYTSFYDDKGKVVVKDALTGEFLDLSSRPDIKTRAETCINKGGTLALYKRGRTNGFVVLNMDQILDIFGSEHLEAEPEEVGRLVFKDKPDNYVIDEGKWKFFNRNIFRNKNQLLIGPSGCGKTQLVFEAAKALGRKVEYFNLGATQDPRSTLIGNIHYSIDKGTYFVESGFLKAIQTPNTIILLDEVSRAHPEAWNILMTVLDDKQRYIKVDETNDESLREIKVAKGVCFIGTANVGNEYTSARVLDKALIDRFLILNLDYLDKTSELNVISKEYPSIDYEILNQIVNLVDKTRKSDELPGISTRKTLELCDLINDGFSLDEGIENIIYPLYPDEDDLINLKQIAQKEIKSTNDINLSDSINKIF
jgi:MoxR-like ATPase